MTQEDQLTSLRKAALSIFAQSLEDCSVPRAFRARVRLSDNEQRTLLHLEGEEDMELTGVRRLLVISVGKGSIPMLECLLETLRPMNGLVIEGVLIAPVPPETLPAGIRHFAGGHPLPNQSSLDGAQAALDLLQHYAADHSATATTFCVFLLSGGASAMLELPLDSAISLDDVLAFHRTLIHSGASIAEINCVRKHFSAVKGGRLALAAGNIRCLTIAVSDVPSGKLDSLGSGPTLPDSSSVAQCRVLLQQYNLMAQFPPAVRSFFASPALAETPKAVDLESRIYTLLSEEHMGEAARVHAERLGFHVVVDTRCDDWDFQGAAEYLIDQLRFLRKQHPRLCLVSPGEVTVRLDESVAPPGLGGRNQQLALYASTLFEPEDPPIVLLSVGSDGIDGNSPAAGALIDSRMFADEENRRAAQDALDRFDAYPLLHSRGAAVITGRTGNNLRDLRLLLTT